MNAFPSRHRSHLFRLASFFERQLALLPFDDATVLFDDDFFCVRFYGRVPHRQQGGPHDRREQHDVELVADGDELEIQQLNR